MNKPFQDFTIRHPSQEDAQATLDLLIACDIAEYGEPDTDLADVLHQWDGIDLSRDAWLVFSAEHKLVGYAAVFKRSASFSFDFYTHPDDAINDLKAHLLARCEARVHEQLAANPATTGTTLTTIIPSVCRADIAVIEAVGFEPCKYYLRMQVDLDGRPAVPTWPDSCVLRTVIPGQDDRIVYDFIYTTFDWREDAPPTFEWWRDYMMRPDHFEPDLWFLLFHQETLIGAALCYDYTDCG
jgi:mycothiol synthase